jgi:hypothetical protein
MASHGSWLKKQLYNSTDERKDGITKEIDITFLLSLYISLMINNRQAYRRSGTIINSNSYLITLFIFIFDP